MKGLSPKLLEVISRKEGSDVAFSWSSDGVSGFEIKDSKRDDVGTTVKLSIKKSEKDYLKRDKLVEELRAEQIGCRAVYDSLSNQPFHRQWKTSTPVANELAKTGLHLPAQFNLKEQDVKKICDIIKNHAA